MAAKSLTRVFVTGASGFIGQHLVRALTHHSGFQVIALTHRKKLKFPAGRVVVGDLNVPGPWQKTLQGCDAVVHLAGLAAGKDLFPLFEANVQTTAVLLDACAAYQVPRFLLASTASVYGGSPKQGCREADFPRPDTAYGLSKWVAETACQYVAGKGKPAVIALRLTNIYGPGNTQNVIYRLMDRLASGQNPIIHGTGDQRRDFLYIDDAVKAVISALKKPVNGFSALNIGSGETRSLNELLVLLQDVMGTQISVIHDAAEAHVAKEVCVNVDRVWKKLHWKARTSLQKGLESTYTWYRSRS